MKNKPKVSIILVNWKQVEMTCLCLKSLRNVNYPNLEIWVVDNASGDGSVEILKRDYPEIHLIENKQNLGFTGGNNVALAKATGDYLMLLNNDTEVPADFLKPLVELFEGNPAVGAASPKIHYFNDDQRIQYAGGGRVDLKTGRIGWRGWQKSDRGQFDQQTPTTLAHGAAFFISRKAMETAGMLNEPFFAYYEEIEWSLRIRCHGFEIYYVPSSLVRHKASMTVKQDSPIRMYYTNRNRIWLNRLHGSRFERWFFCFYLWLISLPMNTARLVFQRKWSLMRPYYRGFFHGFFTSKSKITVED